MTAAAPGSRRFLDRKTGRQRLAFWIGQLFACALTIASIWFASRIGYEEALRYGRYEEVRRTRNLVRAMDHELAMNERALRRAIEDWAADDYRGLEVATSAFEAARSSDEYFQLDPALVRALGDVYGETLFRDLKRNREAQSAPPPVRQLAATFAWHLEQIESTRPLLEAAVVRLEDDMRRYGTADVTAKVGSAGDEPVPAPTAANPISDLSPTRGWERAAATPYTGPLAELHWGALTIPAQRRDPVVITYNASTILPEGRRAVRLWVCFAQKAPMPVGGFIAPGDDDDTLRRLLGGDAGPGSFALTCPLEVLPREDPPDIIDPNRPVAWRWTYLLIEDETGARYPASRPAAWKAGLGDRSWMHERNPAPGAFVLPKGYLAR